jgi:hypothetical protein
MSPRLFVLSLLMTLPVGCGQLEIGRSYLSEMDHDDRSFFTPQEDFPVVAGDTGRDWLTDSERRARTPASESDLMEDRANRSLKNELRSLENGQTEDSLTLYDQYKNILKAHFEHF